MSKDTRKSKACQQCANEMLVSPSSFERKKYCSRQCVGLSKVAHMNAVRKPRTANAGSFKARSKPWNKDMKGIHLSPSSEYKKGRKSERWLPVGSVQIRSRKSRPGETRAFVKIKEPNVWKLRALVNWEAHRGQIDKGFLVHHKNRNKLDDAIENLELLTRAQHLEEHRTEIRASGKLAKQRTGGTIGMELVNA